MFISRCQIRNYKSFRASEPIDLTPGFNVVVGQNNAGKTAFIEALSLQFANKLHKSITTASTSNASSKENSSVSMTIGIAEDEAFDILSQVEPVYVPTGKSGNVSKADIENQ
jgi:AAA15 family ATPase/GTPase